MVPKNKASTVLMAQWACQTLDTKLELFRSDLYGDPMFETLGFSRNGELMCVFIAYQYTSPNIFMAFASTSARWASKENVRALGVWIFGDVGCTGMTTFAEKRNERQMKLQEGSGGRQEVNVRKRRECGRG